MNRLHVPIEHALRLLGRLGPYLLIELLLPGGTLIALSPYVRQWWREREACRAAALPR